MTRADQLLVVLGLVRSRTRAQRLIKHGRVMLLGAQGARRLDKPSEKLPDDSHFTIEEDAEERYVSRAGLKLEALLESGGITLSGMTVIDIGQSTGGFTDCALRFGAAKVIGIEVGRGQLDSELRQDDRVVCLEGINARSLPHEALAELAPQGFDAAVIDVSFISQTLILPELAALLPQGAHMLSLVKPQFELSPELIGAGGLVRHPSAYADVEKRLHECCAAVGFDIRLWRDSPITGTDGNREFLLHAMRS
ncbi:TlyA family RNA methyltransferase [Phytohalomonas tamaricis]|uniref:TlyA family RNA methyltransferase n=1 Tax=Phytohalomonas tamaricis TaxID=2081032 RepID=UPI000D0B001E|nr:TlyA family RNA methyltransferase [Phytohalomonas tamaricis]